MVSVFQVFLTTGTTWEVPATMVSHVQVPRRAREGEHFCRDEKEVGRAIEKRVQGISLPEFLPGKKRKRVFSSCRALLSSQGIRAPSSGSSDYN